MATLELCIVDRPTPIQPQPAASGKGTGCCAATMIEMCPVGDTAFAVPIPLLPLRLFQVAFRCNATMRETESLWLAAHGSRLGFGLPLCVSLLSAISAGWPETGRPRTSYSKMVPRGSMSANHCLSCHKNPDMVWMSDLVERVGVDPDRLQRSGCIRKRRDSWNGNLRSGPTGARQCRLAAASWSWCQRAMSSGVMPE